MKIPFPDQNTLAFIFANTYMDLAKRFAYAPTTLELEQSFKKSMNNSSVLKCCLPADQKQSLAKPGLIIVKVDGLGIVNRSQGSDDVFWHILAYGNACRQNLCANWLIRMLKSIERSYYRSNVFNIGTTGFIFRT